MRELGPAVERAFAVAQSGVPGPVFIECPVDLLYDEASIRQWYAEAGGKGTSVADRALRWYMNRHVRGMFAGSARPAPRVVAPWRCRSAREPALRAAPAALARPSGR